MGLTPVPDEDEFGHGFLLAGAMFIHMLGMRSRFELLDFSSHMLRVASHEANQQTPESGSAAMAIGMVDAVSQSLASSAVLLSRQASERASKRTNERTNERTMLVLVGSSVSVAFRCLFRVPFLGDRLLRASSFHHASNGLSLALSRLRPTPPQELQADSDALLAAAVRNRRANRLCFALLAAKFPEPEHAASHEVLTFHPPKSDADVASNASRANVSPQATPLSWMAIILKHSGRFIALLFGQCT